MRDLTSAQQALLEYLRSRGPTVKKPLPIRLISTDARPAIAEFKEMRVDFTLTSALQGIVLELQVLGHTNGV